MYEAVLEQEAIGWGVPGSTEGQHLLVHQVNQTFSFIFSISFTW
jgi:hypothetical protein